MIDDATTRLQRRVRFWSVLALGSFVGVRFATHAYAGPSIALGLGLALAFGFVAAVLSWFFPSHVSALVSRFWSWFL